MPKENYLDRLTRYISSKQSRRGRLNWERFVSFDWYPNYLPIFLIIIMFSLILYEVLKWMATTKISDVEFLQGIIPVILFFQLLFVLVQTINQHISRKYSLISCSPIMNIRVVKENKINNRGRKLKGYNYSINLVNNGVDAFNVGYSVIVNKKLVTPSVPLFSLEKEKPKVLHIMGIKEFTDSKIIIKVGFEGVINPTRFAKFKKLEGDTTFFTIARGI